MHWLVLCAALCVVAIAPRQASAGCADVGRCCGGKSQHCKYTYNYPANRYSRSCYCDEFCQKSGDCCDDYEDYCLKRAQDCVMTYWSHWSHCTARCGRGMRERRRQIHIQPSGGGKPCGTRRQTRACYHSDYRCRNRAIAEILPAYLNRKRNAPDKYQRDSEMKKVKRSSYCIHYRIQSIAWYCQYASPYHVLKIGATVCAECHDTAMDKAGHCKGAHTGVTSRWMAMVGRPCHGTWKSDSRIEKDCTCPETHGENFIFV